ncbi:hypothetical protein ACJX0J_023680, partial [Zea mays]
RSPLRSVNGRQTSLEWTFHPPSQITDASEATGPFISIRPQEFQTPVNPRVPFFSRSILLGRIRLFSRSIALKIPRVANVTVLKPELSEQKEPNSLGKMQVVRQKKSKVTCSNLNNYSYFFV